MFQWPTFFASIGVTIPTVAGLSWFFHNIWLARYKAKLDTELESFKAEIKGKFDKELETYRETLRRQTSAIESRMGHRNYMGKAQFDAQFGAIRDSFAALAKLRLSYNALQQDFRSNVAESEEFKLKMVDSRLTFVGDHHTQFVDTYESVGPFLPVNIYLNFETCAKSVNIEVRHIMADRSAAITPKAFSESRGWREQFAKAFSAAEQQVREWLEQVTVVS
jgi:hypothetical protein